MAFTGRGFTRNLHPFDNLDNNWCVNYYLWRKINNYSRVRVRAKKKKRYSEYSYLVSISPIVFLHNLDLRRLRICRRIKKNCCVGYQCNQLIKTQIYIYRSELTSSGRSDYDERKGGSQVM